MSYTIAKLRSLSDDELIAEHDQVAGNTYVGTAYYMDELQRREAVRASKETHKLAERAYYLSIVNGILAAVSAVAAIAAIVLSAMH